MESWGKQWGTGLAQGGAVAPFSSDPITYLYGGDGAVEPSGYNGGGSTSAAESVASWFVRWNVAAGVKTITNIKAMTALSQATAASSWRFVVVRKDGAVMTKIFDEYLRGDFGVAAGNNAIDEDVNFSITLAAGEEYYYGLVAIRPAGTTSGWPGVRSGWLDNSAHADGATRRYAFDGLTALPATFNYNGSGVYSVDFNNVILAFRLTYTSPNYIEYDSGDVDIFDGTELFITLPVAATESTFIKMFGTVVANPNNIVMQSGALDAGATAASVEQSLDVDFTGAGDMTYQANAQALNAVTSEDGDTLDLLFNFSDTRTKSDLLWQNMTVGQGDESTTTRWGDIQTISHAALENGRETPYTAGPGTQWNITGTGVIARIQVGVKPIVIIGDSNCGTKSDTEPSDAALIKLGLALPTAFTSERMWWLAAIAGGRLAENGTGAHTSMVQRYKNDTPGKGDLHEMQGALFILGGACVNDVNALNPNTDAEAYAEAAYVASVAADGMFAPILAQGNELLIIGNPPFSADGVANSYEALMTRCINRHFAGFSVAARIAHFTTWTEAVDADTINDPIPEFSAVYSADGTHWDNGAASVWIAGRAAAYYEAGLIDTRDTL